MRDGKQVFVFTGNLHGLSLTLARHMVEKAGAIMYASMTGFVDYLVVGEAPNTQFKQMAQAHGIPCVTKEQFLAYINKKTKTTERPMHEAQRMEPGPKEITVPITRTGAALRQFGQAMQREMVAYTWTSKDLAGMPNRVEGITQVIESGNRTIVMWGDGTKTVVACGKNDKPDPETAILYAFFEKHNGSTKSQAHKALKKLVAGRTVQQPKQKKVKPSTGKFRCL